MWSKCYRARITSPDPYSRDLPLLQSAYPDCQGLDLCIWPELQGLIWVHPLSYYGYATVIVLELQSAYAIWGSRSAFDSDGRLDSSHAGESCMSLVTTGTRVVREH